MNAFEIKSVLGIAFIYILRMLGLFIVLPILSVYLLEISANDSKFLVGLGFGIYGLTQALLQIPFGLLSDYFGRKKMIIIGLVIFLCGSILVASFTSIYLVILGRALQGAGAISAVLLALLSDLTRDEIRTKAMGIIGASIGITFGVSIILAPLLNKYIGFQGIFWVIGMLTILAILMVVFHIPTPIKAKSEKLLLSNFFEVLSNKTFLKLDYGIFSLHASQIVMFMTIPVILNQLGYPVEYHWQVYLPVFVLSIVFMVPMIIFAQRKSLIKKLFLGNVLALIIVQILFIYYSDSKQNIMLILLIYFVGFNFLEATLPSLISRISPKNAKGFVLGIYNSSQSLGIFAGGFFGGLILTYFSNNSIYILSACLLIVWFLLMLNFIFPENKKDLILHLKNSFFKQSKIKIAAVISKINSLDFVEEALIFPSERYIIIKAKNNKKFNEKKVVKAIGEDYAVSK